MSNDNEIVKSSEGQEYTAYPTCPKCGTSTKNISGVGLYSQVHYKCTCGNVFVATCYDFWKNEDQA